MKKILLIGSLITGTMVSAQMDFKKMAIDAEYGVNKAYKRQGLANTVNFVHVGLGARYNVTNVFGFKLGLSFDQFTQGKNVNYDFKTSYTKVDFQGVAALGTLFNASQWTNKLQVLGHMGPGISFNTRKADSVLVSNRMDKQITWTTGITPMFKVSNKVSLWLDASFVLGLHGHWAYDMVTYTYNEALRGIDKAHVNLSLGASFYLGTGENHADWTPNQNGNPAEMEALKAKITKAEKDMMDDDKDGVPNYLDQEAGTAEGANVNTKGQTVKVEKVVDIDGDGILDVNDFCPTIKGAASANGCPDKDGDNVYDFVDKCPNAAGLAADGGCPVVKATEKATMEKAMKGVQFDNGKSTIIKKSLPILDEVAKVMMANPSYKLAIDGHTDNAGDKAKNLQLSEDRAKAVKAYLMGKGVAEGRMKATGYGDTKPKADNKTAKGKAANRRVEFIISFEQ